MKLSDKKYYERYLNILGYLLLLTLFFYLNFKMYTNLDALIESDMSSELVLSNILANENKLFTKSWFYSTELKVLHNQIIFTLLFKLTDNWHTVRFAGMVIVQIILFLSYLYLAKTIKLKHIPWIGQMIVGATSRDYFKFVLLGSHYMPQIAISFISIALFIKMFETDNKVKRIIEFIILNLLEFLAGLGGMRSVMVLQFPLLLTTLLMCFIKEFGLLREGKFNFKEDSIKPVICSLICFITCFIGVFINTKILPLKGYSYQMDGSTMYYQPFSFDRTAEIINGWLNVMGYQSGDGANILLTAKSQLVLKPLFIAFFIISFWAIIDVCIRKNKYNDNEKMIVYFFIINAVVMTLLFVFTDKWYRDRYLLPVSVFIPIVIGIFLSHYKIEWQKWIYILIIAMFMFVNTKFQIKYHLDNDSYIELATVRDVIIDNNCYNGYCLDHWNGHNILTELSDGKIETWTGSENFVTQWLQSKKHVFDRPEKKCFMLILQEELEDVQFSDDVSSYLKYEDEKRVLYIFESYDQMCELVDW